MDYLKRLMDNLSFCKAEVFHYSDFSHHRQFSMVLTFKAVHEIIKLWLRLFSITLCLSLEKISPNILTE